MSATSDWWSTTRTRRDALSSVRGRRSWAGRGLDFLDPWGNHVQIVEYADIQFTREAGVLAGMGLADLRKSEAALAELEDRGCVRAARMAKGRSVR